MHTYRFLYIQNLGRIFGFVSRDVSTSFVVFQSVYGPAGVHQSLCSGFGVVHRRGIAFFVT